MKNIIIKKIQFHKRHFCLNDTSLSNGLQIEVMLVTLAYLVKVSPGIVCPKLDIYVFIISSYFQIQ